MSERYFTRLRELIQDSCRLAETKLRLGDTDTAPTEKGLTGRIAYRLQGLVFHEVDKIVQENSTDVDWSAAWSHSGKLEAYGLICSSQELINWLATKIPDTEFSTRVFEAEIGLLSSDLGERILQIRKQLKSLGSRIELCFKIICALEKKGRKLPADRLDKMKLSFEKMEEKASKQQEKLKAAEAKQLERMKAARARAEQAEKKRLQNERKRKEKENLKFARESSVKKKEREKKAQADLMSRFLNKRVTPRKPDTPPAARVISLDSPDRPAPFPDYPSDVEVVENKMNFELCQDKSVLPVSSWLQSLIEYDIATENLDFLRFQSDPIDLEATRSHLASCEARRLKAEKKIGNVLHKFRSERSVGRENKSPRFATRRSDLRGRGKAGAIKVFKHDKDYRPTYFGTVLRRSRVISGRKPFAKDEELDYEIDSDLEWEAEAEDGESLSDIEDDKELARENAELRELYGSDDESDDDDFLDDVEADDEDDDDSDSNDPVELLGENGPDGTKDVVIDVDVLPGTTKKRRAEELKTTEELQRKKRRKARLLRQGRVEIIAIDFRTSNGPSPLDCYRVTKHAGAVSFVPYDPEVEQKMQVQSNSTNRIQLGEKGTHQLATMVHLARWIPKTKTVPMFLKLREMRKEPIPTQAEVGRAIAQIAIREKREQDNKPCWYLKDKGLAERIDVELIRNATLRNQILQVQHLARTVPVTSVTPSSTDVAPKPEMVPSNSTATPAVTANITTSTPMLKSASLVTQTK